MMFYIFCVALLAAPSIGAVCGTTGRTWPVDEMDPMPAQDGEPCSFPTDPSLHMQPLPPSWTQINADGSIWTVTGSTGGWALNPKWVHACTDGAWCPYMCSSGWLEAQYDNEVGQPWHWIASCGGKDVFFGSGRRTLPGNCAAAGECSGGRQGLHCVKGKLQYDGPSNKIYNASACVPTPTAVKVRDDTDGIISVCRTTIPGSEIPAGYTVVRPKQVDIIAVPPPPKRDGTAMWYTADNAQGNSIGLQYYISRKNEGQAVPGQGCLFPACMWVEKRPACVGLNYSQHGCTQGTTGDESRGGVDYYPYVLQTSVGQDKATGRTYAQAGLLTNNDATALKYGTYDKVLGNPGYGIRLEDDNGTVICDAFWEGPILSTCSSRLCAGEGCAENLVTPVLLDKNRNPIPLPDSCSTFVDLDSGKSLYFVFYDRK
eukprot:TRINITY_DN2441_c0_g1_i1.p1 TRINITY_DN2441_c0_g1~~TRINITY_DN2441_c0_g1_i1.p1  ORF type:complete len:429 (-),score=27.39 TRINITY_DN2441_c0_g1_i1:47-1333(-)